MSQAAILHSYRTSWIKVALTALKDNSLNLGDKTIEMYLSFTQSSNKNGRKETRMLPLCKVQANRSSSIPTCGFQVYLHFIDASPQGQRKKSLQWENFSCRPEGQMKLPNSSEGGRLAESHAQEEWRRNEKPFSGQLLHMPKQRRILDCKVGDSSPT